MSNIIKLENVSFQYESSTDQILKGLSLAIQENDWVSIVGRNGSGKSTFARLLNGLLLPTDGIVTVEEKATHDEELLWDIRQTVGMVFQNPENQFVSTIVEDDLAFGLENIGMDRLEIKARIDKYSKLIGISHLLESEPHRLSGGQKQRVAIAGVMAMQPNVIVFDEATSMLDPGGRSEVLETMKMLHQQGTTIISITHDMDEAILGNRILLFEQGTLQVDTTPREFFSNADIPLNAGLSLPFPVAMQKQLEEKGLAFKTCCLSEEELIAELWTSYSTT